MEGDERFREMCVEGIGWRGVTVMPLCPLGEGKAFLAVRGGDRMGAIG